MCCMDSIQLIELCVICCRNVWYAAEYVLLLASTTGFFVFTS
jgi:hypothetical protein